MIYLLLLPFYNIPDGYPSIMISSSLVDEQNELLKDKLLDFFLVLESLFFELKSPFLVNLFPKIIK